MADKRPSADPAEIREASDLIHEPGNVVELGILNVGRQGPISGYFNDPEEFTSCATQKSGLGSGTYATLNTVNPALLARSANRVKPYTKQTTSDKDIVKRRFLPIDFDPVRPSEISSSDEEHKTALDRALACRQWLHDLGFPDPLYADSGNGAHLLYRVDLPNDNDSRDLIKRCPEALAFKFDDGLVNVDLTTFNASRIWKVYGTVARKGDHTSDRPHRLAHIVEVPQTLQVVRQEQLETLADVMPEFGQSMQSKRIQSSKSNRRGFDLEDWISDHGLTVAATSPWQGGQKWILNPCPWNSEHTDKSAYILQFSDGGIAAGCHHDGCKEENWQSLRAHIDPGAINQRDGARPDVSLIDVSVTAKELLEADIEPPVMLLGENYPAGELAVFHGEPGVGKTMLLLKLILHLAAGLPWFGLKTATVTCGILNLELPPYFIKERLKTLAWDVVRFGNGDQASEEVFERIHIVSGQQLRRSVDLIDDGKEPGEDSIGQGERKSTDVEQIIDYCKRFDIKLLAVDPFAKAHTADENSARGMGNVFKALDEIRFQTGAAILIGYHERKPPSGFPEEGINAIRGTTRLPAEARFGMQLLKRRGERKLVFSKVNIGREPEPIWLHQLEDGTFEQIDEPVSRSMNLPHSVKRRAIHANVFLRLFLTLARTVSRQRRSRRKLPLQAARF
jgi:hypothetical protein